MKTLLAVAMMGLMARLVWNCEATASELFVGRDDSIEPLKCSIYMAPSSLKGHAGYGMFTTRNIEKNESFLRNALGDMPSIVVHDYQAGANATNPRRKQWISMFDEYWWGRGVPCHVTMESRKTIDFQTTFGSLPNHHCLLHSIVATYPDKGPPYDDSMAPLVRSPGGGAFSYNMGRDFVAKRYLVAGSELFLNYGLCSKGKLEKRGHEWAISVPIPSHYNDAARIVLNFAVQESSENHFESMLGAKQSIPPSPESSMIPQDAKNTCPLLKNSDLLEALLLLSTTCEDPEMVASLLPKSLEQLELVMDGIDLETLDESNRKDFIGIIMARLAEYVGTTPRTVEWIEENGMCLEHLVPSKSRIPHAGMGAFAQQPLKAGDIVVPMPLLHVVDKEVLTMYEDGEPWHIQLLMNYCLGHSESSMLLCPLSNAGLINHCSNRSGSCGSKGPNAVIQWSSGWDPLSDASRGKSIDDLEKGVERRFSMEVVALRDIEVGDEVFIDYGIEWEKAWHEHVERWSISYGTQRVPKNWISAKEANDQIEILKSLVADDLRRDMRFQHEHFITACYYEITEADQHEVFGSIEEDDWRNWSDKKIIKKFADNAAGYSFIRTMPSYKYHDDRSYWPCSVLFKESKDTYTVRIHGPIYRREADARWLRNNLPRILTNYPRAGIHIFVHGYEVDQLQKGVFRHPIGVPEGVWPEHWKNLKAPGSFEI